MSRRTSRPRELITTMPTRKIRDAWWVDFHWAGIRYRKRSPLNTRAGAAQYELALRERIMRGEPLTSSPAPEVTAAAPSIQFREFAEQWYNTYVTVNNQPSEQRQRRSVLRTHLVPWFGNLRLDDISTRTVEEFKLHELGSKLAHKTINNHLAILSRCLRSAVQWEYLNTMPTIQLLRVCPPPFRVLNDEEIAPLVADRSEVMWNMMIRVALRTGLRRGELMALKWTDIDIQRRRLRVNHAVSAGIVKPPKTYQTRTVPLTTDLAKELQLLAKVSGFVFASPAGGVCNEWMVEEAIRRVARRLGVRQFGWHTLRHTFATQLAAAGVPLHVVKELLGHSTISMTMRYAHVMPSMLDDAIRVLEGAPAIDCTPKFGQPVGTKTHPDVVPSHLAMAA